MTSALQTLRRDFAGEIITPDLPGHAAAGRTVFAAGAPAYVLRPTDVADVRTAVRFAADEGLPLAVRGGGHGFPGFGTNDGGVVIDLRLIADVEVVDAEEGLVQVGGGATWGQVAAALAEHGLAISSGDTRSVGVGGLTLSGGIGWKVRKHGLALDSLVGAEVVTASGEVVHATATHHTELFWALRGGGGNFGVVTAFEFLAQPTTDVFHGRITFPATEADDVLQGWADHLRSASEDLTSVVTLANPMAGGPQAPVEIHVTVDTDDAAVAAEILEPLRGLGTPVEDTVASVPYADTLVEGLVPPPGLRFVTRSAFVDKESVRDVVAVLAEVATSDGSPVIGLRSVGGAVARVPEDATAYAHRQAELMVVTITAGPEPVVAAARPGLDAVWARLAPHVHGAYANFLSSAGDADVADVYPTETRERLALVKRWYDPGNVFAANHNVRPARDDGGRSAGG